MSMLATLEKTLADLVAKRQRQEAIVRDMRRPLEELESLQQEEAAQQETLLRVRTELEQLTAERGYAQARIDQIDDPAFFADLAARLETAARIVEREDIGDIIGIYPYTISMHAEGFRRIGERIDADRAIVARTTKRIRELGGK